jgi:hypothetical protein
MMLDRVTSNLLDGFLLGATSTTSRVVAPRVVSTTSPSNLDDNLVKAHTQVEISKTIIYKEISTCFYISILQYTFYYLFCCRLDFLEVLVKLLFRILRSHTLRKCF